MTKSILKTLVQVFVLSLALVGLFDTILNIAGSFGIGHYVRYYGAQQMILCPVDKPALASK